MSKYQPHTETWHHMWTDNQGDYFEFIGSFAPEGEFFEAAISSCCGRKHCLRMYCSDVRGSPEVCRLAVYDLEKCGWHYYAEVRCKKLK